MNQFFSYSYKDASNWLQLVSPIVDLSLPYDNISFKKTVDWNEKYNRELRGDIIGRCYQILEATLEHSIRVEILDKLIKSNSVQRDKEFHICSPEYKEEFGLENNKYLVEVLLNSHQKIGDRISGFKNYVISFDKYDIGLSIIEYAIRRVTPVKYEIIGDYLFQIRKPISVKLIEG